MNNSIFWKTMRNVIHRNDVKLGGEEFSLKQATKCTLQKFSILYEDCTASHTFKQKVKFD